MQYIIKTKTFFVLEALKNCKWSSTVSCAKAFPIKPNIFKVKKIYSIFNLKPKPKLPRTLSPHNFLVPSLAHNSFLFIANLPAKPQISLKLIGI